MAPSLQDISRHVLLFTYFFVSNMYALIVYMVWMTLLTPLRILAPNVYWKIESELFFLINSVCISWISFGGYKAIECGDDVGKLHNEECLLLSNHQSTADVPIVMYALHNKKMAAAKVMWVIYKPYRYTNFGIVCVHREDFFIDSGKAVRQSEMTRLKTHLATSYLATKKKWITVFPEGGFLCRQREVCRRYAEKNNYPLFDHVLLPRVGAVKAVLDTVGEKYDEVSVSHGHVSENGLETPDRSAGSLFKDVNSNGAYSEKDPTHPVKWVIDMTIAYKDKKTLELLGIASGLEPRKDVLIHWRAYRVKDIPRDEASLTSWLYKRYEEKEKMLDAYYKDGTIPGPSENSLFPQMQTKYFGFDLMYLILSNAALVVLFYLQYVLMCKPCLSILSYLWYSIF